MKESTKQIVEIINEIVNSPDFNNRIAAIRYFAEGVGILLVLPTPALECLIDKFELETKKYCVDKEVSHPILKAMRLRILKENQLMIATLRAFLKFKENIIEEIEKQGTSVNHLRN